MWKSTTPPETPPDSPRGTMSSVSPPTSLRPSKSILKKKRHGSPVPPPTTNSPRPSLQLNPRVDMAESTMSSIEPPPRGLRVEQDSQPHHSQSHDSPQPKEKSPLQNNERKGDYTLTKRDAIIGNYGSEFPLSEPKKILPSSQSSFEVKFLPGLLRQANYYNEDLIDYQVQQEIKEQIIEAYNKYFKTFFSYIKDNDLKRLIASIEQGDYTVPYFPNRQQGLQKQNDSGHWDELVFSDLAFSKIKNYEFSSEEREKKDEADLHYKDKYKEEIHAYHRYLPKETQKYYKLEDICEVLKYVTSEKTASEKCDKQFVRIRKWEVILDEKEEKIIDCSKPNFGHTYYLYYNENYGFLDYKSECFVKFGSSLLDLGWFFEDIMPRISPPYNNRSIIKSFVLSSGITFPDFFDRLGKNVYVRQYTFFADARNIDEKPYTITDKSNRYAIKPKILFTIDVSNDTVKYNMNMMDVFAKQRLGRNSFKDKKCFSNSNKKTIYSVSHKPVVKILIERRPSRGGKNKRKVSQVNKKDVLGKQRNVYKFVGDKKEYIKYKNEYVLLKKYKEMQKTKTKSKPKTKSKTKPKTKSKSKPKTKSKPKPKTKSKK
jgi:hypothetical protein